MPAVRFIRHVLFAVATLMQSPQALAQDKDCLTAALRNYTELKTTALMGANPILSPEATVGLRRLEEASDWQR
jgi:hypothetical protein